MNFNKYILVSFFLFLFTFISAVQIAFAQGGPAIPTTIETEVGTFTLQDGVVTFTPTGGRSVRVPIVSPFALYGGGHAESTHVTWMGGTDKGVAIYADGLLYKWVSSSPTEGDWFCLNPLSSLSEPRFAIRGGKLLAYFDSGTRVLDFGVLDFSLSSISPHTSYQYFIFHEKGHALVGYVHGRGLDSFFASEIPVGDCFGSTCPELILSDGRKIEYMVAGAAVDVALAGNSYFQSGAYWGRYYGDAIMVVRGIRGRFQSLFGTTGWPQRSELIGYANTLIRNAYLASSNIIRTNIPQIIELARIYYNHPLMTMDELKTHFERLFPREKCVEIVNRSIEAVAHPTAEDVSSSSRFKETFVPPRLTDEIIRPWDATDVAVRERYRRLMEDRTRSTVETETQNGLAKLVYREKEFRDSKGNFDEAAARRAAGPAAETETLAAALDTQGTADEKWKTYKHMRDHFQDFLNKHDAFLGLGATRETVGYTIGNLPKNALAVFAAEAVYALFKNEGGFENFQRALNQCFYDPRGEFIPRASGYLGVVFGFSLGEGLYRRGALIRGLTPSAMKGLMTGAAMSQFAISWVGEGIVEYKVGGDPFRMFMSPEFWAMQAVGLGSFVTASYTVEAIKVFTRMPLLKSNVATLVLTLVLQHVILDAGYTIYDDWSREFDAFGDLAKSIDDFETGFYSVEGDRLVDLVWPITNMVNKFDRMRRYQMREYAKYVGSYYEKIEGFLKAHFEHEDHLHWVEGRFEDGHYVAGHFDPEYWGGDTSEGTGAPIRTLEVTRGIDGYYVRAYGESQETKIDDDIVSQANQAWIDGLAIVQAATLDKPKALGTSDEFISRMEALYESQQPDPLEGAEGVGRLTVPEFIKMVNNYLLGQYSDVLGTYIGEDKPVPLPRLSALSHGDFYTILEAILKFTLRDLERTYGWSSEESQKRLDDRIKILRMFLRLSGYDPLLEPLPEKGTHPAPQLVPVLNPTDGTIVQGTQTRDLPAAIQPGPLVEATLAPKRERRVLCKDRITWGPPCPEDEPGEPNKDQPTKETPDDGGNGGGGSGGAGAGTGDVGSVSSLEPSFPLYVAPTERDFDGPSVTLTPVTPGTVGPIDGDLLNPQVIHGPILTATDIEIDAEYSLCKPVSTTTSDSEQKGCDITGDSVADRAVLIGTITLTDGTVINAFDCTGDGHPDCSAELRVAADGTSYYQFHSLTVGVTGISVGSVIAVDLTGDEAFDYAPGLETSIQGQEDRSSDSETRPTVQTLPAAPTSAGKIQGNK